MHKFLTAMTFLASLQVNAGPIEWAIRIYHGQNQCTDLFSSNSKSTRKVKPPKSSKQSRDLEQQILGGEFTLRMTTRKNDRHDSGGPGISKSYYITTFTPVLGREFESLGLWLNRKTDLNEYPTWENYRLDLPFGDKSIQMIIEFDFKTDQNSGSPVYEQARPAYDSRTGRSMGYGGYLWAMVPSPPKIRPLL